MSRATRIWQIASIAGAAAGVVAAGAVAGVLAERKVVTRRKAAELPLGSMRGRRLTVIADDKLDLYAELDEPTESGDSLTVVFVHGYALNLDCWHFQRADLRGEHRLLFYDQRSHGRSDRSRKEHCTLEQLGHDLADVLDQLVPDGPVVLVGHSMGGMTVLELAAQRPELFVERVVGVGLISTSAGGMNRVTLGLPGFPGRLVQRLTPAMVATLARAPRLVEGGRRTGSDLGFLVTRRLTFGAPVAAELVDFTDEMLSATPFEVVADFYPTFALHDRYDALKVLSELPVTVISGTLDRLTPFSHSERIANKLPSAEFLQLDGAGHMPILERPHEVNGALRRMIRQASRHA